MVDAEAFDRLYRASRDRLVMQIAALTGDPVEAMDHVQEGFVRAWARWDRVGGYDDPEGWVRRVSFRLAVSRWRRARRLVLGQHTAADRIRLDGDQLGILDALRALPAPERRAVVLHHVVGLGVQEIAAAMDAPAGTVKSWLARGRTRLSALLDEPEEAGDERR